MREIGRVISLEGEVVSLALENEPACAGCAIRPAGDGREPGASAGEETRAVADLSGCPVCAAFASGKTNTLKAVNAGNLPLQAGDRVVVTLEAKKTVTAALLLFVLPLAAFMIGYASLLVLSPSTPEEFRLLGGAVGFALSYLFVFVRRLIRKKKDWPVVVEKCE